MIILVTGWFPVYKHGIPTGEKQLMVSHGIDLDTGRTIVTSNEAPNRIEGAVYDENYCEWVIND